MLLLIATSKIFSFQNNLLSHSTIWGFCSLSFPTLGPSTYVYTLPTPPSSHDRYMVILVRSIFTNYIIVTFTTEHHGKLWCPFAFPHSVFLCCCLFVLFCFFSLFIYFVFGCVGSLLLHAGFLQLRAGATLRCSVRASHCGCFSCWGTRALERRLSSCGTWT